MSSGPEVDGTAAIPLPFGAAEGPPGDKLLSRVMGVSGAAAAGAWSTKAMGSSFTFSGLLGPALGLATVAPVPFIVVDCSSEVEATFLLAHPVPAIRTTLPMRTAQIRIPAPPIIPYLSLMVYCTCVLPGAELYCLQQFFSSRTPGHPVEGLVARWMRGGNRLR
jgi:hypothetical protein